MFNLYLNTDMDSESLRLRHRRLQMIPLDSDDDLFSNYLIFDTDDEDDCGDARSSGSSVCARRSNLCFVIQGKICFNSIY